jgi:hypothetical protein
VSQADKVPIESLSVERTRHPFQNRFEMCAIESYRFTGAPYRKNLYQKASPRKATTESHDSLTLTLATMCWPFIRSTYTTVAISTSSDMSVPDTRQPIFDPGMDVATLVFSHVRCVKTRVNLSLVSKLWRDASKPAAAYPLRFDWRGFPDMDSWTRSDLIIDMMDNDEALSLPYKRVAGLLGETVRFDYEVRLLCRGSVRLLKWTRENNHDWSARTCCCAAEHGHLPALKYLHEKGYPWNSVACYCAAQHEHWDCLQYAVDNKCDEWEKYADKYAEHLR